MSRREIHTTCPWVEVAQDDTRYNLVAVAFTPWHALSIDALIHLLIDRGVNVNAAIVITAHPQTGYALDESFFTNTCSTYYYDSFYHDDVGHVSVQHRSKLRALLGFYKSVFYRNRNLLPLYYVTNSFAWMDVVRKLEIASSKNVIITYSEEGVASYMGTLQDPNRMRLKGIRGVRDYIRYQVFGNYIYRAIHPSISVKLLRKGLFGLRVNNSVLTYYVDAFEALNRKKHIEVDKALVLRSVVICTTAWERTQIQEDEDLRVVKKVCDVLHEKGVSVLLKTHPRDTFFATQASYLGAQMFETGNFPMECICAACRPLAIFSFSSTILVTAKLFWNIPTFCLSEMLNKSKIGAPYLEEIQCFCKTFRQYTTYIQSEREIAIL